MKIYCAGAGTFPTITEMIGVFSGIDVFSSYFDISRQQGSQDILPMLRKHEPRSVVCDSGAHAYFSAIGGAIKSASPITLAAKLPPPKEYVAGYAEFIVRSLHLVDVFVEMDTVLIHGERFQKWQRDCLLEAVRGDRSRIMPVYHACEKRKVALKLIDEFPYVGIEGKRTKNLSLDDYMQIVHAAYKKKCKVHAFASVDNEFLTRVPFYSSDSSSWSMIYRSGVYVQFTGRGMTTLHRSEVQRRFHIAVGHAQSLARVTTARSTAFRYRAMIRTVIEQYEKFAHYLTELWNARGIVWQ